jgi:uncharacterized protein YcbK (DUF882 family)
MKPVRSPGSIPRRQLLRSLGGALGLWILPRATWAVSGRRTLSFVHLHTGEELSLAYRDAEGYRADALARLAHHLRDFRTGEVRAIDPRLFDILHELQRATGSRAPFQVISGYRSAGTNERLRGLGRGVAPRSLHLEGRAIDVRLADVDTAALRDAALALRRGGVGYYAASDFVHLDTGRVRRW